MSFRTVPEFGPVVQDPGSYGADRSGLFHCLQLLMLGSDALTVGRGLQPQSSGKAERLVSGGITLQSTREGHGLKPSNMVAVQGPLSGAS